MLKICQCGKPFEPTNNRQKYCSDKCSYDFHAKQHRRDSRPVLERTCLSCNKLFETTDSRKQYCCNECKIKYCNDKRHRPNKGIEGLCEVCGKPYVVARNPTKRTCSERCARFKCKYDGNRLKALARDNFTCQLCGKSKKARLNVHHKDGTGQKEDPNHSLDNLVTLCIPCHQKVHKLMREIQKNKNLLNLI